MFRESDAFVAELEFRCAQLRVFQREQIIRRANLCRGDGEQLKRKRVGEESQLTVQVVDR
jgi:hypothetical protein